MTAEVIKMPRTPQKNAYSVEWDKTNTKHVSLKLNCRTDADIISHLESVISSQGELKRLIRLALGIERKNKEG